MPPRDPAEERAEQRLMTRFGRDVASGDVIFTEGTTANEAFLLHVGRVRIIKRVGGVERSLRILKPGELFGETALMHGGLRGCTAIALTDSQLLALDRGTFQDVLASHPAIGERVLHQVLVRLRDAEDQIEILMLKDSQSKVALALLKGAEHQLGVERGDTATLSLSPMELSLRAGLDVETVKRNVQRLRDRGYVEVIGERIELPSLAALREFYALLGVRHQIGGGHAQPISNPPRGR